MKPNQPLKIGVVTLDNPTVLAPLAGITDLPFRSIVKETGCALVCSEMISANGICHRSPKTLRMLASRPQERPLSVQLFGADPAVMAQAAQTVEAGGADILDINFGCAVRKIVKTGSGVALMKTPGLAERILQSVRKAVGIPLTIKIRSGWDASGSQALEIARLAEACGVDAVTVHPRTAGQAFRGKSDWALIAAVKAALSIPVIGNGDIVVPEDALAMIAQTGCDGVMIGRAALRSPWIFAQIIALLEGAKPPMPDTAQRLEMMTRYVRAAVDHYGETHACRILRTRLGWFVKGLPRSSKFRETCAHLTSQAQAEALIEAFLNDHCSGA